MIDHYLLDFFIFSIKSACTSNPCKNNATCQTGFTERGYRCLCVIGFTGHECGVGKYYLKKNHGNVLNVLNRRFLKAVWFSKPNKLNLLALILPANNTTITLSVFGHKRSSFPRMIKVD